MINVIQNTIGSLTRRVSTAASIITQNLQMWLGFTSSSWVGGELVVLDESTNTNNAKLFTGKALSFDGVNDSVDVPSFSLTGERTFAIWFKTNSTLSNRRLFNLSSDSGSCNITLSNGLINCYDGTNNPIASTSFNDGVWHRLVIVMKSNDVKIYVDKLSQTLTTTNWINRASTNKQLRIGSNTGTQSINGYISYAEIYNAAWDSDDAVYDYANPNKLVFDNESSSIVVGDLVGYWALSEGSGSIAYDSSDGGNNGTINGATFDDKQPTIPQLGMMDWSNASGKTLIEAPNNIGYDILGNALRLREGGFNLDGSGYGSIANSTTLTDITNGTIQFWLKTSDTKFSILNGQSSSEFIGKTDNGVWTDGNVGTITAYKDGSTANTSPVYDGAWHFYTFTGVNLSTWTSFLISNLTSFELDCIVDEVLIYDDVLTATEIDNNFNVSSATHS